MALILHNVMYLLFRGHGQDKGAGAQISQGLLRRYHCLLLGNHELEHSVVEKGRVVGRAMGFLQGSYEVLGQKLSKIVSAPLGEH